ncbi:MAG: hypothetical protein LBN18_08220 [Dysgonamonadaceae bacterium]|nr:hypothetical protein [Dysgonamonadaceae bacterium]
MNNSEIPVCYYLAWGDAVSTTVYPDTLLPEDNVFQDEVVRPKKMGIMYAIFHTWEEAFRLLPADTLSIFILDAKKLNTYTWKDVRSSYTVLQRYDLSIRDLQNLNFILTYPPTREMKLIKGYSPQKADKF